MFSRNIPKFFGLYASNKHLLRSKPLLTALKSMSASTPPLHDVIKPLAWLIGKWKSETGKGYFPTIDDFSYGEELEFFHVGQPNLQFSSSSWDGKTKKKLHRECGFLRLQPGTANVALICAQNAGLAEVEEGQLVDHHISLESHTVGRLSFGKPPAVRKIKRSFKLLDDGNLEQVVDMETEDTPMTEHLRITYQKIQ